MMRKTAWAVAALALAALPARAATLDGVTLQDSYPVAGKSLVLNGIAARTLTVFGVRIYVAGLYLATPSHDAATILNSTTPKVLLLQYLHAGSKAEVEKEYRLGEKTNCGAGGCDPADQADFDRMVAAAPAVKVGDTTTFVFINGGVQVFANNQPTGTYTNKDMAYHLLEGFIGQHPPSPELRSELLGIKE